MHGRVVSYPKQGTQGRHPLPIRRRCSQIGCRANSREARLAQRVRYPILHHGYCFGIGIMLYGQRHSFWRQCRGCGFWVTRAERFCTDCGVFRPYQSGRGQRSAWLVFTTMLGGVLGGSVFYRPDSSLLLYGCIAGCATGLAWGLGLFAEVSTILQGRRRSPSLQSSELRLAGRLAEILQSRRQVRELAARLRGENGSPATGQLLTTLRKAEGAVERAIRRYTAELAKLELIRWRNGLEPLVAAPPEGSGFGQVRERLDELHRHRERGNRLLATWRAGGLDAPDMGRDTVRQLQRWLAACDRIIERTIAEQAHITLNNIAAAELVPGADPEVETELRRIDAAGTEIEPDELDQVQHALDRLRAREQLDREFGSQR